MTKFLSASSTARFWPKTLRIKFAASEHAQFVQPKLKTLAPRLASSIFMAMTIGAQAQSFNVSGNGNWVRQWICLPVLRLISPQVDG